MTPGIPLLNAIGVIVAPEKIICDNGVADAAGPAFTSTVAVIGAPIHPLAVGVIVNVTVMGAVVVFVKAPVMLLPDPLAAIPVTKAALSLVQVYVAPGVPLLKAIEAIVAPEQIVCDNGVANAFGTVFTNTVAVIGLPPQLFAVGVIVKVTVTGLVVVFVSVPLMLPFPLAAIPVTGTVLSLVHA